MTLTTTPFPYTAAFQSRGSCGWIHPSCQPRSTIWHSIVLIVTAVSSMLRVHEASHGAGQIRPVNSGKLLVEWSVSSATRQSSSRSEEHTSELQSLMRITYVVFCLIIKRLTI